MLFLKHKPSGDMLRVDDVEALANPRNPEVCACDQAGQEEQDPQQYAKAELVFPSGEPLPRCWTDANYQLK